VSDPGKNGETNGDKSDDDEIEFQQKFHNSFNSRRCVYAELGGSVDDKEGAVVMGREASAEAVHGSVDGLDGVRGRELPLAVDGAELDAAFAFGFGDTIAQEYETGANGQGK
jgi:hypothetical protein